MARGGFWAGVVFVGATIGAVVGTVIFVANHQPQTHSNLCTVTAADGATYSRTAEAANNAALISSVGAARGAGTDASTVAIATAIQESGLRNLEYGDRDSLGLFQQRPSQGWGTEEQIMDPHFSAYSFYKGLRGVEGWQDMTVAEAAQSVQRSAFPDAYADHADEAAAWAAAFRGDEAFGAVDCDLDAATQAGSAKNLAARITADYGEGVYTVSVLARNDRAVLLGLTAASGEQADLDALANWAVAVADEQSLASVRLGQTQWVREEGLAPNAAANDFAGVQIGVVESLETP